MFLCLGLSGTLIKSSRQSTNSSCQPRDVPVLDKTWEYVALSQWALAWSSVVRRDAGCLAQSHHGKHYLEWASKRGTLQCVVSSGLGKRCSHLHTGHRSWPWTFQEAGSHEGVADGPQIFVTPSTRLDPHWSCWHTRHSRLWLTFRGCASAGRAHMSSYGILHGHKTKDVLKDAI